MDGLIQGSRDGLCTVSCMFRRDGWSCSRRMAQPGLPRAPCSAGSGGRMVRFGADRLPVPWVFGQKDGLVLSRWHCWDCRHTMLCGFDCTNNPIRGGRECLHSMLCGFRRMDGSVWGSRNYPCSVRADGWSSVRRMARPVHLDLPVQPNRRSIYMDICVCV